MSVFDWLTGKTASKAVDSDVEVVQRISQQLQQLDAEQARHIASFAYLLGRVANADLHVSAEETARMDELVAEHGGLSPAQAAMVVRMSQSHAQLFGGTDDFLVTREFAAAASREQKLALLQCMYAVSAADHSISAEEDQEIRRVASGLGLHHRDFIAVRLRFAEHLDVLRTD